MKPIGLTAALALLFSLPVTGLAQGNKPAAAKPQAVAVQQASKPAMDSPRRSRANEDARVCLELATNTEIIKCAEDYR